MGSHLALRASASGGALFSFTLTLPAADATPLSADDFEPIHGLLAARTKAKSARRYNEADALMEMLTELGVGVDDRARLWRADGRAWFVASRCPAGLVHRVINTARSDPRLRHRV